MKLFYLIPFFLINIVFTASISGTIREKETGEPLPYANIMIEGTSIGTASDINGYYIIPSIDAGVYVLKIMMIGYAGIDAKIIIEDLNLRLDFELQPQVIGVDEVKVSAERMRFEKKVDISRVNITNREIRRIPAFMESDVFRALQLLPSVTASNDFNAALIVRGGSPDENLVLLDGTEIYNPYHIGGIFSAFNADMISNVEFLAGAIPSNYGGRLSSVLSITAREGDSKNGRLSKNNPIKKYWDFSKAAADISLLSSKILAEGALYNGSWMISGRRTYFDQFTKLYYKYRDEPEPARYYFWDTHIKLKTALSQNNQLFYSQFSGNDNLGINLGGNGFPAIGFDWDWGNYTNNITWKFIPTSNYFVESKLSQTIYDFTVDFAIDFVTDSSVVDEEANNEELSSEDADLTFTVDNLVKDVSLEQLLTYIYSEDLHFKLGWQYKTLNMDYKETFAEQDGVKLKSIPNIKSIYINSIFRPLPIFSMNLGVRLSKYSAYEETLFDPRISVKYNPISDLAIKLSWGNFSQFLYTTNQEEELLRIVDFWQPIPDGQKPQQSEHYILGAEYWISSGNTISIETYYKKYLHLYDLNPLLDPSDVQNTIAVSGIGDAYGFELLYRLNINNISGWIGYAFSNIVRQVDFNSDNEIWEDKEIYTAKYNKPHSFISVLNYKINEKYDFGISAVYESGQTYTAVVGKVHQAGYQNYGSLEKPYNYFGNIYAKKNGARYPAYFRVDMIFSKKTRLFGLDGKLKFQVINILDYYNILLYNWNHNASPSEVEAYSMFPRIFTLGWEFNI